MHWDPLMQQRDFCTAMDIPVESKPVDRHLDVLELGRKLIEEEYTEVMEEYDKLEELFRPKIPDGTTEPTDQEKEALAHVYLQAITAELADLVYVICQSANMHGLPLREFYTAIHKANMEKVDPNTGKVEKISEGPKTGKVKKPEGWKPADLSRIYLKARMPNGSSSY